MENDKVEELLILMSISFDNFCAQYEESRQGRVVKTISMTRLEKERMNFALRLDDDKEKTWEGYLFNIWASKFFINKDGEKA
jgi:hypothetical protein